MKDICALLKGKKFLSIMKIIICGLWKELERDKINTCRLTSKKISVMSEQYSCNGTSGKRACEGDFPFLYEYKTSNLDFVL